MVELMTRANVRRSRAPRSPAPRRRPGARLETIVAQLENRARRHLPGVMEPAAAAAFARRRETRLDVAMLESR